ncbi:MAG: sugar transferase [Actinomycetota bacterium]|nr:sugar transferase [Actinomycetota bacterium]
MGTKGATWRWGYLRSLLIADLAGVLVGALIAKEVRSPGTSAAVLGTAVTLSYPLLSALVALLWIVTLTLNRVFNVRVLGAGADEYRRIFDAIVRMLAVVAALAFFLHLNLSRSYVAIVGPITLVWTLVAHWSARQWLHRQRRSGSCQQATVVVGSHSHVADLVRHLRRFPYVGLHVVGACTGGAETEIAIDDEPVPVVAAPADLVAWIRNGGASAVVVADAAVLGFGALRHFAWQLEGSGVDLVVAPSVTGVAGPRIAVRPVEGLPLLHLEEPRFDGVTRLLKGCVERCAAILLLVALLPLMAFTALAVKVTSTGPIFYRQTRVGKAGLSFKMLKFRTMVEGADKLRHGLQAANEHGGDPLFKVRLDPRVTPVGRWLRRLSIDELPQLAHVVTGKMAVVGPRPPLPEEVEHYTSDAWRRLLVRPGITGLWQVSGRSSLPWMETLRLDLYYVDNWSLALDLVITIKTFNAVIRGRGAY